MNTGSAHNPHQEYVLHAQLNAATCLSPASPSGEAEDAYFKASYS